VGGAFVGFAALLLAPQLARFRKGLLIASAVGVGLLPSVGAIALALGPERAGVGLSLTVRLEYWEAAVAMWREAPLRGLGINQFREFYSSLKSVQAEEAIHAHSAPLQLLAETGLVGLVLFTATLAATARAGLRVAWGPMLASKPSEAESKGPLGPLGLLLVVEFGLCLGWILLGVHGDTYHLGTLMAWLAILVGLLVLTAGISRGLAGLSPRLIAGAALAGSVVLIGDGLLNFGVHHAGLSVVVWLLIGLAPSFAPSHKAEPTPGGWLPAAGVVLTTLGLVAVVLPGALEAEGSRAEARHAHELAARGEDVGQNLLRAEKEFALACAAAPRNARTWLERGAVLATLAERAPKAERAALLGVAIAATEEAIRLAPRKSGAHFQLGRVLVRYPATLIEAQAAFDRTVELYPAHPEHLLEAAGARVARIELGGLRGSELEVLARGARGLLDRAEEVSRLTRLKRIQLRPAQVKRIARLRQVLDAALPKD
ncbi:MAG: O-antigen ligase family protein, partial [Planctomycetes bacterium]|nr:O-antigen ligase family protein [Planctomycetota bacterium]